MTLISLKGMRRLFSSLESNPRIRAAWRKFLLVAARAFIATSDGDGYYYGGKSETEILGKING